MFACCDGVAEQAVDVAAGFAAAVDGESQVELLAFLRLVFLALDFRVALHVYDQARSQIAA